MEEKNPDLWVKSIICDEKKGVFCVNGGLSKRKGLIFGLNQGFAKRTRVIFAYMGDFQEEKA